MGALAGFGFGTNLIGNWLANPIGGTPTDGSATSATPVDPGSSNIMGMVSSFLSNPIGAGGTAAAATQSSFFPASAAGTGDVYFQLTGAGNILNSLAAQNAGSIDFLGFINGLGSTGSGAKAGAIPTAPAAAATTPSATDPSAQIVQTISRFPGLAGLQAGGAFMNLDPNSGIGKILGNVFQDVSTNGIFGSALSAMGQIGTSNAPGQSSNFGIFNSLSSTAGRYQILGGSSQGIQSVMQALKGSSLTASLFQQK